MTISDRPSNPTHRNPKLHIISIAPRPVGGSWVQGTLMGFKFEALVFAKHAIYAEYEIERSRISKLALRRLSDGCIVYHWDRGLDIPAIDDKAQIALTILCERVASIVFDRPK